MMQACHRHRKFFVLLSAVVLGGLGSSSLVQAELVEIALPELTGAYPRSGPVETVATFAFALNPTDINGVYLRVSGTAVVGTLTCDGATQIWPLVFDGLMIDTIAGGWWSAFRPEPLESGAFSWTAPFEPSLSTTPTWSFLAPDGNELIFSATTPTTVGLCQELEIVDPTAVLAEVVLIFDIESAVAAQPANWGALKARYR
jgi:hypothetical protein